MEINPFQLVYMSLHNSVDAVDFGIQVFVFRLVFSISEAVSSVPITLARGSLALIVGGCGDRFGSRN